MWPILLGLAVFSAAVSHLAIQFAAAPSPSELGQPPRAAAIDGSTRPERRVDVASAQPVSAPAAQPVIEIPAVPPIPALAAALWDAPAAAQRTAARLPEPLQRPVPRIRVSAAGDAFVGTAGAVAVAAATLAVPRLEPAPTERLSSDPVASVVVPLPAEPPPVTVPFALAATPAGIATVPNGETPASALVPAPPSAAEVNASIPVVPARAAEVPSVAVPPVPTRVAARPDTTASVTDAPPVATAPRPSPARVHRPARVQRPAAARAVAARGTRDPDITGSTVPAPRRVAPAREPATARPVAPQPFSLPQALRPSSF